MKKFVAIGHWAEDDNITCAVADARTMKEFKDDLKGNAFIAWVVLSEDKLEECKGAADLTLFAIVKKLTSNYRRWNDICEYLEECMDIIEAKLAAI